MPRIGKAHFDDDDVSTVRHTRLGACAHTESPSKIIQATDGKSHGKLSWATYMPTIERLYFDEDRSFGNVMEIMLKEYGFYAT